jgi:hypothetical protein
MQLILLKLSQGVTVDTAPMSVLDVLDDVLVELAFQLIASDCGVPFNLLSVEHDGSKIEMNEQTMSYSLVQLGILDGSTLIVRQLEAPPQQQRQAPISIFNITPNATPEQIIRECSTNPMLLSQYKDYRREQWTHIVSGDVGKLRMAIMKDMMRPMTEQYVEKQDDIKFAGKQG